MKTLAIVGILNVHKQTVIHMIYFVNMMINDVRATLGVSKIYFQREIVTQWKLNMNRDCREHLVRMWKLARTRKSKI